MAKIIESEMLAPILIEIILLNLLQACASSARWPGLSSRYCMGFFENRLMGYLISIEPIAPPETRVTGQ